MSEESENKLKEKVKRIRKVNAEELEEWLSSPDDRPGVQELFKTIKEKLPELEQLLAECNDHSWYEDKVYRFYHHSFKVYHLQELTLEIVSKLQSLAPDRPLDEWFMTIIREGTEKEWKEEDNKNWLPVTRPILEAFFHAKYFLKMLVKYGKELEHPPRHMPSGWASVLCLYDLRY